MRVRLDLRDVRLDAECEKHNKLMGETEAAGGKVTEEDLLINEHMLL